MFHQKKKNYGFDHEDNNATNKNWIWSLKDSELNKRFLGKKTPNIWGPAEHVTSVIQLILMERLIWENNKVRKNNRNGLQLILVQDLD